VAEIFSRQVIAGGSMLRDDLRVIGITRFSVVSESTNAAFRHTRDKSIEAARAIIRHPDRLRRRFCLFRTFSFPSLAVIAERYEHFRHILLTSPELPEIYKDAVKALALKAPWLKIVWVNPRDRIEDNLRAAIADFAGKYRRFTFRLDDDDALCATYIDDVLMAARHLPDKTVISFDDGYWLYRGLFSPTLLPKTYPLIAIGLGYLSAPDDSNSIHALGPHTEMGQRNQVHHITGKRCWLRTVHDANDSRARNNYLFRPCFRGNRLVEILVKDFPHIDAWRAGLVLSRFK
jgi:hypothetical protein